VECFVAPQVKGLLGNSGRNIAFGPGLMNYTASLFKNNHVRRISETFNLQLRAEVFNILNHTNFQPPIGTATQVFDQNLRPIATAGQLTATSTTSRQIQFGVKLLW
jgi:hypothetical protein